MNGKRLLPRHRRIYELVELVERTFEPAKCEVVVDAQIQTGLDFLTAFSAAGTSISNVGPGLGDVVGPAHTFKEINDPAKWIMCAAMLVGRLELFTVLVLFIPNFWRA